MHPQLSTNQKCLTIVWHSRLAANLKLEASCPRRDASVFAALAWLMPMFNVQLISSTIPPIISMTILQEMGPRNDSIWYIHVHSTSFGPDFLGGNYRGALGKEATRSA